MLYLPYSSRLSLACQTSGFLFAYTPFSNGPITRASGIKKSNDHLTYLKGGRWANLRRLSLLT